MEKREVESSVIGAVGHSRVLEIEFESGRIYQYFDVPKNIYTAMLNAPSKRKYFNAKIRGKFPYQEIELNKRVPATAQKGSCSVTNPHPPSAAPPAMDSQT